MFITLSKSISVNNSFTLPFILFLNLSLCVLIYSQFFLCIFILSFNIGFNNIAFVLVDIILPLNPFDDKAGYKPV